MNKDLIDIPNRKIFNNHVKISSQIHETKDIMKTKNINDTSKLKETSLITKEFKDIKDINISNNMNPQTELLLNSNDIFGKEQSKLIDVNNKKLNVKIRKVDIPNSTSVFPVK